ncbi:MAG: FAD binding domain-containing protein, partial [Deltaproteobacteria bacterium]
VFIALDAKLKVASLGGERVIDMEEFSKDYLEVALEPDEMLTEIQVPIPPPHTGTAHEKLMVMQGDQGIVGAAVSITLNAGSGVCKNARIAISNVDSIPLRAGDAERQLIGKVINDKLLDGACHVASTGANPPSDVHASEEYRREMIKVFVKRVTNRALERAKKG